MSKKLRFAVQFSNFAQAHKLTGHDLAQLIELSDKVFKGGVVECNQGKSKGLDAKRAALASLARGHGLKVSFDSGLYPMFYDKKNYAVALPSVD